MPNNPKTINKILEDFNKRTNEFRKGGFETLTIECVRGILSKSLTSLFTSIIDEIESSLPKEDNTIYYDNDRYVQGLKTGYNDCLEQVIKILSDLREGK